MKLFVIYCFVMTFFVVLPLVSDIMKSELSESNQITARYYRKAENIHMNVSSPEKFGLNGFREKENSGK